MNIPVCGHVIPEVHVHLLAAVPNGRLVEYVPRSERILQRKPAFEGGALVPPDAPGLRPALDQDAVIRYAVGAA